MISRQVTGQSAVSYSYDAVGNLTSASMPQASTSFTYNPRNQLSGMTRPNGVFSAYTYDVAARLLTLTHATGSAVIDSEIYTYDAVGNRSVRSTAIGHPLDTQSTVNQYNVADQLTQFGSSPKSYDADGNLLQESNITAYTWDSRHRLKSIVTATGQMTNFTYDFAGNLIAQSDSGTSLNLTKSFLLDTLTNVTHEFADDGTSYDVLSGRSVDSHLAIVQSNGQVQYGLSDAINTTVATVDQSGAGRSQFVYDTFGKTSSVGAYPFRFSGRVLISSSLYYYRARYYDSATGRFISEDPLTAPANGSPYAYVHNNPINRLDPTGKFDYLGILKIVIVGVQLVASPIGEAQIELLLDNPIIISTLGAAELQALNILVTNAKQLIEEMSKDPEADEEVIEQLKEFLVKCGL
jgi:RHS repeat-associated protein